jgi:nucleotide-binding universal stress UspA family protein
MVGEEGILGKRETKTWLSRRRFYWPPTALETRLWPPRLPSTCPTRAAPSCTSSTWATAPLPSPPTEYRTAAQERLDELVKKVEDAGGTVAEALLRMDTQGSMEDENIVGLAEELGADLIVIGSRGLSRMKRLLMGSVSESVVRHAHCPVLVMRH